MEQLIELSPFFLAGIGLASLFVAILARIFSKEKQQSKIRKVFNIVGFIALFAAAGISAWMVLSNFQH
jgi:hypothetical protein